MSRAIPAITLGPACLALAVVACAGRHPTPPTVDDRGGVASETLTDALIRLDPEIPGAPTGAAARAAAAAFAARVEQCGPPAGDPEYWAACALNATLGDDGIRPTDRPGVPAAHTATFALVSREGSCSAIVAAVLAVSESQGASLEAIVLRDHVVLTLRDTPGVLFEPLERGRRLTAGELARHGPLPPGGPVRTDGRGFLPYYLDNLAARLAEAGDAGKAEDVFRQAVALAPKAGRIRFNLGTFLLRAGRNGEAEESLHRAIRLGWDDAGAWVNRGVALWKLGKPRPARRCFEKALAIEPGNREAATNLRALSEKAQPGRPR